MGIELDIEGQGESECAGQFMYIYFFLLSNTCFHLMEGGDFGAAEVLMRGRRLN
jgi:hypothetical protein